MRVLRAVFAFLPGVLLLFAAVIPTAEAGTVTCTYTGNDYVYFRTPLTASDFITASFTLASVLPDGLTLADESGAVLNWTTSDQVATLSRSGGNYLDFLLFTTDASGDITNWHFLTETSNGCFSNCLDQNSVNVGSPTAPQDDSNFLADGIVQTWAGGNVVAPGVWAVTTSAETPEPATFVLFGHGSVFALGITSIVRRFVRRAVRELLRQAAPSRRTSCFALVVPRNVNAASAATFRGGRSRSTMNHLRSPEPISRCVLSFLPEAASHLPVPRTILPDLPERCVFDIADGRSPAANRNVTITLQLRHCQRTALRVPDMGDMRGGQTAKPRGIPEVRNHYLKLPFSIRDIEAFPLQPQQFLDGGHSLPDVTRPVFACAKPLRVVGSVVILFDGLVENVHSVAGGVTRHLANAIQVPVHDHRFQEYPERQTPFFPYANQCFNSPVGPFEELLSAADDVVEFSNTVKRDGNARRAGQSQRFNPGLIFPITVGQDFKIESERSGVGDQLQREGLQHRLPAREDNRDRPQPGSHIVEDHRPALETRRIFLTLVPPDVAVHTTGIAALCQQEHNGSRPAISGKMPSGERAKAVIHAFIQPMVDPVAHLVLPDFRLALTGAPISRSRNWLRLPFLSGPQASSRLSCMQLLRR